MDVYSLLYHLKKCPSEFLLTEEKPVTSPGLTEILVKDTYRKIYGSFNIAEFFLPINSNVKTLKENHKLAVQIACWFFSYEGFRNKSILLQPVSLFLFQDLLELSELVKHTQWIEDDDRAEEFVRLVLKRCAILPDGETAEEASDKFDALDTIKRLEVLKDSTEAMERVREIRRKMAEEKAREAANVYGRE